MNDDHTSTAASEPQPAMVVHSHPKGPTLQRLRRELKEHEIEQVGVCDGLLLYKNKATDHPVTEGMAVALIAAGLDLDYPLDKEDWQSQMAAAARGHYNERLQEAIDLLKAHLVNIEYGKAAIEIMSAFGGPTEPRWSNLPIWKILPELNAKAKTIAGRVNDPRTR